MLKTDFRITRPKEYNYMYHNGRRIGGKHLILFVKKNALPHSRFGIVASKKVGKAVIRNRVKRRIRNIIRNNLNIVNKGYDLVIVVRASAGDCDYPHIEKDFINLVKKARLE